MVNSKDYVKARRGKTATTSPDAVAELKQLLEGAVDNGRAIFIESGYIPLSRDISTKMRKETLLDRPELIKWLEMYNWQIVALPVGLPFDSNTPIHALTELFDGNP